MIEALDVSVDDRRALWALTARHLRSAAHPAVLVVRHAIRRGARRIEVRTRGKQLIVTDDGDDLDVDIADLAIALRDPHVDRLHALERARGTDLLVAIATAASTDVRGRGGARLATINGAVVVEGRARPASTADNVVTIHRPRALRSLERQELRAWLPSPRAEILVDGARLGTPSALPSSTVSPQTMSLPGGRLQLGFALDETVTRLTIHARGVWVAQEQLRARGLPIVAIWDDDRLPVHPIDVVADARDIVAAAGEAALRTLAARFQDQPIAVRRRLRSLLVRAPRLPAAFFDVPLFDNERQPFALTFSSLQQRRRLVIGSVAGDVVVDDEASAFLHRLLPHSVVDAVPPPRRRLAFIVRRLLR